MLGEGSKLNRVVRTVNTPFEPGDARIVKGRLGIVRSLNDLDMTIEYRYGLLPDVSKNEDIDIDGWKWFVHAITADKIIFRLRGLTRLQIGLVTHVDMGLGL